MRLTIRGSHMQICVIQINFMYSFAKIICCVWFLKSFAKMLHTVNSLVSIEDYLPLLPLQLTWLKVFGSIQSVRVWHHYSVWATCMLIIANLECKPALLSIFFPTFLHFTKFCIGVCVIFKKKRGAGSVTVRRPVPVPFPVLWLLAHNMIDQSTILYFMSRVLLVWKH